MDKKLELAELLAPYLKGGTEYDVVRLLFHDKSLSALRVGIFKALGKKVPNEIEEFLKERLSGEEEEDERFYEKCFLILPDLIKSFRCGSFQIRK